MTDDTTANCASCTKSETELDEGANLLRCSRCKTVRYCSKECQTSAWKDHKRTCVPPIDTRHHDGSSSRKRVLCISLEDYSWLGDLYDRFFTPMRARCDFVEVKKISVAINSLATNPAAVIIFEPSMMKQSGNDQHVSLHNTLEAYARAGGTVIFACQCSGQVTGPDLRWYFSTTWNLPWYRGEYTREDYILSPELQHINGKPLPNKYNVKALQLAGVDEEAMVYYRQDIAPRKDAAVVWQQYGDGHLAWLGDVNNEEDTRNIIMIMCGLWHRLGA